MTIIVFKRNDQFIAQLQNHASVCGGGDTASEAIGCMIGNFPEWFGVTILREQ